MSDTSKLMHLRMPFKENQIGKLPKPTRQQTDEVKRDFKVGVRCNICGGWHHPKVIHLDYVGHAALTDRFLDVDENWNWEPFSVDENGLPALDRDNLLWIRLTICGVTRIGVGDAGNKSGGDAMKERIGDALRNAGMRFGAALDLWHKGELHDTVVGEENITDNKLKDSHQREQTAEQNTLVEKKWYNDILKHLPLMVKEINAKTKTAAQIIENLEKTYKVSSAVKDQIKLLEK